jgi:hypothetical protein
MVRRGWESDNYHVFRGAQAKMNVNDEAKQILTSLGFELNRKNYLDLMGYNEEPTPEQEEEFPFPDWAKSDPQ